MGIKLLETKERMNYGKGDNNIITIVLIVDTTKYQRNRGGVKNFF